MNLKELLSKMTLEQKLAQMSQFNAVCLMPDAKGEITGPARSLSLTEEDIACTGSTLNFLGAEEMIRIQKEHLEKDPLKIPLLFMQDVVHGYRTIYPIPLGMGATFDPDLMEECCRMAAKEAAIAGVQVTFGPMVDLVRDARWGRNMETTGEDPYLNCLMSSAQVKGFQGDMTGKYDVAACVKHFAAYGGAESGRDYNTVDMSEHTLRQYYLPAYKAAVDAGVEMVMTSFNLLNGVPSSGNKWLVDGILRKEWGFDKIVISDYNAFREMKVHGYAVDDYDCAEKAINAGTDIEMMSNCYLKNIRRLIDEKKVKMSQIDKAVMRILELKQKMGLFDNPYASASSEEEKQFNLCPAHREIARRSARKSAVLLKNEGVLPFAKDNKSIAVVGPFANVGMIGFWSCGGEEDKAVSVLQGVQNAMPNAKISFAQGCVSTPNANPDKKAIAQAVKIAKKSKCAIVCVGEERAMSGEGNSRVDITLSPAQKTLIREVAKVNKNTVVVLFNGRPLALSDIIDDAPAFFTLWQPGSEGGNAACDLIFGDYNFEGKLPMTFPYSVGQAPIYYNAMRTGRPKKDDKSTGGYCSRYLDGPNAPLFPFGYGLSYTTFEISKPYISANKMTKNDTLTVTVGVKNTGKVKGSTVVQMYINDCVASLVRPVKELKAFKKIELDAGEETKISFNISVEDLKFYTASGKYEAENGEFIVYVSDSSAITEGEKFELV